MWRRLANSRANFEALPAPGWQFVNDTPSRMPLTDWLETTNAKQAAFRARSVVEDNFLYLLVDKLTTH